MERLSRTLHALALATAILCGGCGGARRASADATPPPARAVEPDGGEPDRGIDPRRLAPYFGEDRAPEAVELLDAARYPEAREAFLAFAGAEPADSVLVPRARFVAAVCAHRAGDHETALAELPAFVEPLPLVADHAYYMASVSAYRVGELDRATDLASKVSPGSPLRPDADLVAGDALRAQGRFADVERHYRAYVYRQRGGPRFDEATFKLGEAIERQIGGPADLDRVREAILWYRRVTYRHPRSTWAADAASRVTELAKRLPDAERRSVSTLSADEQLELAEAYARAQRHVEAMREFEKVLALTDPDGPLGCQARLGQGRAAYNARKRALADTILTEAVARCDEPDLRVWALYLAGRARTSSGQDRGAVAAYETLEDTYPEHRLADDARLRRAQALERLGDQGGADELLRELPDAYPAGDMRCEGTWQLAWGAYRRGELEDALAILRRSVDLCDDPAEGAHGREAYWAARILERLGRAEEAAATYEAVVREAPLTYYMMLALRRLEDLDAERAGRVVAEVRQAPAEGERPFRFDPAALKQRPGLVRGIELLRLRLESLARIELAAESTSASGDDDLLWLVATLHDAAGDYPTSVTFARRELADFRGRYPVGEARRRWLIGFPRGYREIVEREAAAAGVEPELLYAVMREESSFSPRIESFANAVGLLQLLPTTAARFAKGLPADRESLRQPEINIPIAARYLKWLLDRHGGSALLAIASYNAGEGAVGRWRSDAPGLALDEALESFTYDETRRYTRRVLTSYGTYHYLYGDRIPQLLRRGEPMSLSPRPRPAAAPEASSGGG